MSRRRWIDFILVVIVAAIVAVPAAAPAEVRIVEDEVVFSLAAPGANEVFLAGDFNNWNPTYEKMEEAGGRFEVRLFLLPGKYRYKFVVDGTWTNDPDNPPADPSHGSLVVLVERLGVLTIGEGGEGEGDAKADEILVPSARYSGAFFVDAGETESEQTLDVGLSHASDKVNAAAVFRTGDGSWGLSPLRAEVLFDAGHIDLLLGESTFKGFENDIVWSSSDPFQLLGDVGVYGYNAGFDRRGFSAELPFIPSTKIRGFYSDTIGERPGPSISIESGAFGGFGSTATPDTLVYRYAPTFEDEDVWAVEFSGGTGGFEFGYTRRANKGYQPGSVAEVRRTGSSFATSVYTTREFWGADVGWLEWRFWSGLSVLAGFGRGTGEIQAAARSSFVADELGDAGIAQVTEASDREFPGQTDSRWVGGLAYETERASARALYTRSDYDFEGGIHAPASAAVTDIAVDGTYSTNRWRASAALFYLDQDYGVSPDDFHFHTPQRNAWLDHRDKLTPGRMVSFDLEKSTEFEASFLWGWRALSEPSRADTVSGDGKRKTAALASIGVVTRGLLEAAEYVSLRLAIEQPLRGSFFAQWDSRLALYDKPSWGFEETFFSTYLEAGYRNRWTEVTLGAGFDPVVFDPVVSRHADIGRENWLRRAIPAPPLRSASSDLGRALRQQERLLEDYGAVKLEIILVF